MEAIEQRLEIIPPFILVSGSFVIAVLVAVLAVVMATSSRRRRTKRQLESCGLPTVLWRPRFVHYTPREDRVLQKLKEEEEKKLPSSSITGILPRMERLGGPFGMYGTVYGVSTAVVHVAHPTPAKSILMGTHPCSSDKQRRVSVSQSSGATKSPAYNHFKNFSGDGVFTADGEEWKAKRASVIHCLLRGVSNPISDTSKLLELEANHAADTVIAKLERTCNQSAVDNIVPILQKATIGLIYRYITHDNVGESGSVGSDAKAEESGLRSTSSSSSSLSSLALPPESSVASHQLQPTEICSPSLLQSYLASVNDIRMIILAQSRSFWILLPRWIYRSCSAMYEDEERTMGPIRDFAQRACARAQPGSPLALLQEQPSHGGKVGKTLTNSVPKAMLDEAITLLFAGQDTSAATLSWTLHLLSLHLDVQSRVAEEVRIVMALHHDTIECDDSAPFFTKKFVSRMPLLDAVIKEAMRLYPVAPFIVRRLTHDVSVEDESRQITLPAETVACIWIYGLHRNSHFWHRPDDFVPDRWTDASAKARDAGQRIAGAYMPFAAGPRNCVGQPLAHAILRIVLARLLYQYEFRDERLLHAGQQRRVDCNHLRKDMQAGFTVLPAGGLPLAIRRRETS